MIIGLVSALAGSSFDPSALRSWGLSGMLPLLLVSLPLARGLLCVGVGEEYIDLSEDLSWLQLWVTLSFRLNNMHFYLCLY